MSQQDSEEEQVRFHDVAICFSEKEWKILQEWQKDFYKHVMNEIHQALLMLGYQIVNAETWLRIYKDKDAPVQDSQAAARTVRQDSSLTSPPAVVPDILFRITNAEDQDCGSHLRSKEIGVNNSCFPVVTAAFSLTNEEELELYPVDPPDSERRQSSRSATGSPFYQADVCSRNEDVCAARLLADPEVGERSPDLSLERVVSPEVFSLNSGGDEKINITDDQDCEIIESMSDTTGDGSMNVQQRIGVPIHCTKTTTSYRATSEDNIVKACQSSHKGPNRRNQQTSERYMKINGEKTSECESGFSHTEYFSRHQERAKERISKTYNECESDLWNSQFLHDNIKGNQPSYTCNECDKSFSLKSELSRHVEAHSVERAYAFADYEKVFLQNTHTSEKPYLCTFCHKSFSRKDYLCGHIRTHTGERPHICADCGKNFTWRSHLTRHRKNKH